VAVFKGALLPGLAPVLASPARTVVAVGVEGRVNVNQIHAGVGQFGELFQIVAAINDAGVEEGGRFQPWSGNGFFRNNLFRHAWSLENPVRRVKASRAIACAFPPVGTWFLFREIAPVSMPLVATA